MTSSTLINNIEILTITGAYVLASVVFLINAIAIHNRKSHSEGISVLFGTLSFCVVGAVCWLMAENIFLHNMPITSTTPRLRKTKLC